MFSHLEEVINSVPAIDAHCHPFRMADPRSLQDWEQLFTLFVPANQVQPQPFPTSVVLEILLNELAQLLGCPVDEVLYRRAAAASNFASYAARLFEDAKIVGLIMDKAFPPVASQRSEIAPQGTPVWEVLRIEPVLDRLLERQVGFSELVRLFEQEVTEALATPRCVGLKTIIAYRTGLDLNETTAPEAETCLETYFRGKRTSLVPLRNYLVCKSLEVCAATGKAMQIHTGLGDQEINFRLARPELLYPTLSRPPYSEAKVVLVHAGYPWHEAAASMAAALPNVYLDVSLVAPYVHFRLARVLEEILAIAPVTKVLYGSDGYNIPEMNWLAARLSRKSLAEILTHLVVEKAVREEYSIWTARRILWENAAEAYGLEIKARN